jgi:hydrogenase maturation protease
MGNQPSHAPVLIFSVGNPSRGDDALGPAMTELLETHKLENHSLDQVDLLTDFQLQIEHSLDLNKRQIVVFIDASVSCSEPFEISKLVAARDDSFTTHAMSPAAVLSVYQQINNQQPPPAYLLAIRAYHFGLGKPLSTQARENLHKAFTYVIENDFLMFKNDDP